MTDKEKEDYLFKIVKKTVKWLSMEETTTNEEIADFVMLELLDLK